MMPFDDMQDGPDPTDASAFGGHGKSKNKSDSSGAGQTGEVESLRCVELPHLGRTRIPPRPWAYGRFLLFGHAAALAALDGVGKGAIAAVMALAMITGRPLLGERIWRKGPVAIITFEDDQNEWHRRIAAACEHYGVDYDLALASLRFLVKHRERICFAKMGEKGPVSPTATASSPSFSGWPPRC